MSAVTMCVSSAAGSPEQHSPLLLDRLCCVLQLSSVLTFYSGVSVSCKLFKLSVASSVSLLVR